MTITRTSGYQEMSRKAASLLAAQVTLHPNSVLGLATGSTPIGIYDQLAAWHEKGELDFSGVTTINLDEYAGLPSTDPQSYRFFMDSHLFRRINIDPANTHLPQGTAPDLQAECLRYEQLIADCGGIDIQLLGLGNNGHIGFNEPGDAFEKATHLVDLSENTIEANKRFFDSADQVPRQAITMGMKAIMQARKILLVVSGKQKADILERALHGPITPAVPGSLLQLHPDLHVMVSDEG